MEVVRCVAYLIIDSWNNKYEDKQNYGKIYTFIFVIYIIMNLVFHACKDTYL